MYRTPTEELKVASAYLETAEESFNRATAHLEHIQGHQAAYTVLLARFQATFNHLHSQLSDLEQRFTSLCQNGRQDQ